MILLISLFVKYFILSNIINKSFIGNSKKSFLSLIILSKFPYKQSKLSWTLVFSKNNMELFVIFLTESKNNLKISLKFIFLLYSSSFNKSFINWYIIFKNFLTVSSSKILLFFSGFNIFFIFSFDKKIFPINEINSYIFSSLYSLDNIGNINFFIKIFTFFFKKKFGEKPKEKFFTSINPFPKICWLKKYINFFISSKLKSWWLKNKKSLELIASSIINENLNSHFLDSSNSFFFKNLLLSLIILVKRLLDICVSISISSGVILEYISFFPRSWKIYFFNSFSFIFLPKISSIFSSYNLLTS